jgi:hypothetical protein
LLGVDVQPYAVRFLGRDEFAPPSLDHFYRVVAAGDGGAPAAAQVLDDFALCEHPQDVRIDVGDVDGSAGDVARPPPLGPCQRRRRLAALHSQDVSVGLPMRARDDLAAAPDLLEGDDADGLLTDRARVAGFGRLEQVACDLAEAIGSHPTAGVVDGDGGTPPFPVQRYSDAPAPGAVLGVVVGCVGHELVEGVLGILVGLAGDEDGLGQVADAQAYALAGHVPNASGDLGQNRLFRE